MGKPPPTHPRKIKTPGTSPLFASLGSCPQCSSPLPSGLSPRWGGMAPPHSPLGGFRLPPPTPRLPGNGSQSSVVSFVVVFSVVFAGQQFGNQCVAGGPGTGPAKDAGPTPGLPAFLLSKSAPSVAHGEAAELTRGPSSGEQKSPEIAGPQFPHRCPRRMRSAGRPIPLVVLSEAAGSSKEADILSFLRATTPGIVPVGNRPRIRIAVQSVGPLHPTPDHASDADAGRRSVAEVRRARHLAFPLRKAPAQDENFSRIPLEVPG